MEEKKNTMVDKVLKEFDLMPYNEVVRLFLRETDFKPVKTLDNRTASAFVAALKRVLPRYNPVDDDMPLRGMFVYQASQQEDEDRRDSWAITPTHGNDGYICLSVELLAFTPAEFVDYVFVHELAHLYQPEGVKGEQLGHDDNFVLRQGAIMLDLYGGALVERFDSVDASVVNRTFKSWKM